MERQHDGTIEMLVYMFKEATGHEIPKDARANMDTMNAWMETEGVKFIIEAKEAAQKESEAASSPHNQKNEPKKTKKQIEKEERLRAAEAEKTKTIRSIYLSLAKVLHPDTELDENEKHQKEALMKRVTVAYQENNLQELLKLELEWIHQQSIGMEHIAENKLKIYVEVLEEQARNLDHEYVQMTRTPDLASYSYYLTKPKASVETFLNRKKKELSVLLTFLGSYNSFLVEVDSKQMFVGQLLVHYEPQDDFMSELDFIFR
jgi:hypothetical protein